MDPPLIIKESEQRKRMQNGYRVTRNPIFPQANSNIPGQTYKCEKKFPMLFISESPERTPANSKSLKMIQEVLRDYFVDSPRLLRVIDEIPATATAISFAMSNFRMTDNCYHFYPKYDTYLHVFYTYQKLSENIQLTYFHENNVTYLAGICYFPPTAEQQSNCCAEQIAISMAIHSKEPFLRKDRYKQKHYRKYKVYGRDCGGKRVTVYKDGTFVEHLEVDYVKKKMYSVDCEDCKREAANYVATSPHPMFCPKEEEMIRQFSSAMKLLKFWTNLTHEVTDESKIPLRHRITGASFRGDRPKLKDLYAYLQYDPHWVIDEEEFQSMYFKIDYVIYGKKDKVKFFKKEFESVRDHFLRNTGGLRRADLHILNCHSSVPLVHKITKERLREDLRPRFVELVPWIDANPGWKFDKEIWMELINYWEDDPARPLTIVNEDEVRRILATGEIHSETIEILRKMNKETVLPMVKKLTNEPAPKYLNPKVKELTVFFLVNKGDYMLDEEKFKEISSAVSN